VIDLIFGYGPTAMSVALLLYSLVGGAIIGPALLMTISQIAVRGSRLSYELPRLPRVLFLQIATGLGNIGGAIEALAGRASAFDLHCLNCIIHECTHNLAFESIPANRLVAILANVPSLVPSAMAFWHYHLLHHYHFGVRGMDSDVPADWEARTVKNRAWRKLLWLLLLPVSYGLLHPLNVRARLPLDRWLALNLVCCAF